MGLLLVLSTMATSWSLKQLVSEKEGELIALREQHAHLLEEATTGQPPLSPAYTLLPSSLPPSLLLSLPPSTPPSILPYFYPPSLLPGIRNELLAERERFSQLQADFEYNLSLLEQRDKELSQYEEVFAQVKTVINSLAAENSDLKV